VRFNLQPKTRSIFREKKLTQQNNYPISVWPVNEATANIAFAWLLYLRWGAVLCQATLIFAAYTYLEIEIPLIFVSLIIIFEAVSNLFFTYLHRLKKIIPEWLFGLVMFLDIIFLTALLYLTGGPMNPFTFLYLVHIVLGAVLMQPLWSWSLTVFTVLCYSSFFVLDPEMLGRLPSMLSLGGIWGAEFQEACHPAIVEFALLSDHMKLHLKGMLLAFAITSFFIVFFVGRIQKALEEHQQTLVSLEEERARSEKLAALATLSAGAAHEFSTPLSTIAVAAGEMLLQLKNENTDQGLISDAQLIKDQVKACKNILYQMAADAGEHLGEALEKYTVAEVMQHAIDDFSAEDRASISVENEAAAIAILVPFRTLVRTFKGLIKNGIDASPPGAKVFVRCFYDDDFLYFQVKDQGAGMDLETRSRAPEPFFSTKEQGKGLGLGLFLAKNVAEQFGGGLTISSEKMPGTSVTLSFGLDHIRVA
jgi:two-component system sensor histidine kinase RegB